jgi:hypothetical protein
VKIWELHNRRLPDIRSAPDGHADVAGLLFSEKAYLLALQDYRPDDLLTLVQRETPAGAAEALIRHFAQDARPLVLARSYHTDPRLCRSDELADTTGPPLQKAQQR